MTPHYNFCETAEIKKKLEYPLIPLSPNQHRLVPTGQLPSAAESDGGCDLSGAVLGPHREQEEMEGLAPRRRKRRQHSSRLCGAEHSLLLLEGAETPGTSKDAFCLDRIYPVTSNLHFSLLLGISSTVSGGLSLPYSLMLLCRLALCRQCGRLRDQSKDEPWRCPVTHLRGGDGAELEVMKLLGPCSITALGVGLFVCQKWLPSGDFWAPCVGVRGVIREGDNSWSVPRCGLSNWGSESATLHRNTEAQSCLQEQEKV